MINVKIGFKFELSNLRIKGIINVLLESETRNLCCAFQQKLEILSTDEIEKLYKSTSSYEKLKKQR